MDAAPVVPEGAEGEPGVGVEVVVHGGQPGVAGQGGQAGRRSVDDRPDGHHIGVLPLGARQLANVLPHEPGDHSWRQKAIRHHNINPSQLGLGKVPLTNGTF